MDLTRADEAERAVLGAMLGRGDSIDTAATYCGPTDFADVELGELFAACTRLRSEGHADKSVDPLMVAHQARTFRRHSVTDLVDLAHATPVSGNVGFYAKQVRAAAVRRAYLAAAMAITDAAQNAPAAEDVVTTAAKEIAEAGTSSTGEDLEAKSWDAISRTQDAAYDWVVPGFLERGDRFVLTGSEGLGKSFFLRQAAMMTAAGLHFLTGKSIEAQRVLVVDVENSERQWRRTMRGLAVAIQAKGGAFEDRLNITCTGRLDLTRETHLAALYRLVDRYKPAMLVIGPLYKLTPRAINSDDDAAPLITALDGVRDRGVTICLETHMGHTKSAVGDRDVRPRGSAALLGWPEFGMGLAPSKAPGGEPGQTDDKLVEMIPWRGMRDFRPWPDALLKGGEWPFMPLDPIRETW